MNHFCCYEVKARSGAKNVSERPRLVRKAAIALSSFRRERATGLLYGIHWFWLRFYYRELHRRISSSTRVTEADLKRPLTVVVPATDKDTPVLPYCLRAAKKHIRQSIKEIIIVAPESVKIRQIADAEYCRFVHEDVFLPQPAAKLNCRGWLLQQMIKFNGARHVTTDEYLVLDSDTVFLRPQCFFSNGRAVLRFSDQYELLYNAALEKIFRHSRRFPVSFVTHHMMFTKGIVEELLNMLEIRFNRPWYEAIRGALDVGHPISFSEFELYGNYVVSRPGWRRSFILEYWHGLDCNNSDLCRLHRFEDDRRLSSVSFHWHTQ